MTDLSVYTYTVMMKIQHSLADSKLRLTISKLITEGYKNNIPASDMATKINSLLAPIN